MADVQTAFEVGRLYKPIKTIADVLTASQKDVFVRLPGLIAYWPCGIRRGGGVLTDHSGNGLDGTQTGTAQTGYDGNPFVHLGNGVNYFLNSSASFNLTGTESYIDSSIRGITFGGWAFVDALPPVAGGFMSKDGSTPQRGYNIQVQSSGVVRALFSGTGAATVVADSASYAISVWRFVVARFIPSTEVAIFVDGDKSVNTTAIPASQFVSTQNFEIGRTAGNDANVLHSRARDCFFCAAALSDALIEELRETSTP